MQNYKSIIKLIKYRIKLNKNSQYSFRKYFGYAHWSDTTDYAEQESLFAITFFSAHASYLPLILNLFSSVI